MYENDSAKKDHRDIMERINAYDMAEMEKHKNATAYEIFKRPPYYLTDWGLRNGKNDRTGD